MKAGSEGAVTNRNARGADPSKQCDPRKAAEAAELVRRDFDALVDVFDRQLAILSANESENRSHVTKAKAAAERGLKLSQQLIQILREQR
jgi:hypothetical protein